MCAELQRHSSEPRQNHADSNFGQSLNDSFSQSVALGLGQSFGSHNRDQNRSHNLSLPTVKEITEGVRGIINSRNSALSDEEVLELIEGFVLSNNRVRQFDHREKKNLVDSVFYATRRDLDILQPYCEDEEVSEIMVNGAENIFVERAGKVERLPVRFQSTEELEELIRRLAGKVHREINELNPIVDARLEDGSRINAVYKNVALKGPVLTIRRFPKKSITMEEMIDWGTLSRDAALFLKTVVRAGYNIFVSGGTSSGKTTFLNVLSEFIPGGERVIVIEDSAELQIAGVENLVQMETRNANVQGKGQVTMRQLIKASLRMRPDRIIVGEVRGEEVVDMVQAMNTGHDGSLSTGHGNSPAGMIRRLEAMFLTSTAFPQEAVKHQLAEALDIIVHLGRTADGKRKVLEISEVDGVEAGEIQLRPLYRHHPQEGLLATGSSLKHREKLEMKGMTMKGLEMDGETSR